MQLFRIYKLPCYIGSEDVSTNVGYIAIQFSSLAGQYAWLSTGATQSAWRDMMTVYLLTFMVAML